MQISRYLIFISMIALLLSPNPGWCADKAPANERFKLFNAEYNSATIQKSQTTIFLEKRLFKIDTLTGETWMLIDVIKEGQDIKYWKKITEKKRQSLRAGKEDYFNAK